MFYPSIMAETNTNNQAQTETQPQRPPKKFPFGKLVLYTIVAGILTSIGMKYIYAIHFDYSNLYPYHFLSWRINFADEFMNKGRYNIISPNRFPASDKDMGDYVEMAQEKKYFVTDVNGGRTPGARSGVFDKNMPAHFPRGHVYGHTHTTEINFKRVEDILHFKADLAYSRNHSAYTTPRVDEKTGAVSEMVPVDVVITNHDRVKQMLIELNGIFKAIDQLTARDTQMNLEDVAKEVFKPFETYVNLFEPDDMFAAAKARFPKYAAELTGPFNEKHLEGFLRRMGQTRPTIFDTYFYSLSFELFYWSTLDAKLEGMDDKKVAAERRLHVARIFSKIFTKLYCQDISTPAKNISKLESMFGKSVETNYIDSKKQEKFKLALEKDEENTKILRTEMERIMAI